MEKTRNKQHGKFSGTSPMQCLTVFLLVCLGLASASTSDFDGGHSIDRFENVDETLLQVGEWMIEQMRRTLEKMAEEFERALEKGNTINERAFRRAEEIYHKLLDLGIEVSEKVKEILERIGKEFEKKNAQGPVGNRLKEAFENIVTKMNEAVDSGKGIRADLMKKAEDIYAKLKNPNVETSENTRTAFEDPRSKFGRSSAQRDPEVDKLKKDFEVMVEGMKLVIDVGKGIPQNLFKMAEEMYEKLKNLNVEISEEVKKNFEEVRKCVVFYRPISQDAGITNIFDALRRFRQQIKEKLDVGKLEAKAEDFGKENGITATLVELLTAKGEKARQKILDWIDRILPNKERQSISEKLLKFFQDLHLDLKEKFTKFGEWIKEQFEKGLKKGKTRTENINKIAKEFIKDTRVIGKDMAEEALGFFREYKNHLGKHYENVVDKIEKILKR